MTDQEAIIALGAADARLDALDKEIAALEARIPAAEAARDAAAADVEAAREALEAARSAEKATAREVGKYNKRREQAVRALESGMGSAESAQKQIDQCDAIIDDLETRELEEMETIEARRDALASAEAILADKERHLASEREAVPPILADRQVKRASAQGERDAIWPRVPKDLQSRYAIVRQKKKTAVSFLVDGYCSACRMAPPLQESSEIARGFLITCKGCGRYLVPPP